MTNLIGQSIGRYHILEQLGEGGMANVYKAHDTRLERDVAIKIIRTGAFGETMLDNVLKRFEREAKALAKFSHPHIVKVMDYGEYEGSPYLVMEYLPGGTLKQRVGKPVPWKEAVRLVLPIAQALEYAHAHNIIHRDIKPANVLLTDNNQPMLSDFGIAKILEASDSLTGTGMGIGTPDYMAPEQWTGGTSRQSDLYSLGIVLYELIVGRKPYMADTPVAVMLKQVNEALPRPRNFIPDLPQDVENVLIKALEKNPENRFPDMETFRVRLESLLSAPKDKPLPTRPIAAAPVPDATLATQKIPYVRPPSQPAPNFATQRVDSAPRPTYAPPHMDSTYAPAPPKKRGAAWALGVVGAGILLLICVVGGGWFYMQNQAALQHAQETAIATQATATKAAAETEAARQATAVKLSQNETATAVVAKAVKATGAAIAQIGTATAQWRQDFMGGINGNLTLVYGPQSGSLAHNAEDTFVEEDLAGVDLTNFVVQATFVNPYSVAVGGWDYGFLFRNAGGNNQYRLIISSSQEWSLRNNTGSSNGTVINEGTIDNLSTINGGQNIVRVVCVGTQGFLYVNETLISELDLSDRTNSGDIAIATGLYSGDEITGYATRYVNLTIWLVQ